MLPATKAEEEAELKETYEALTVLLSDDSAFDAVLNAVFENMDSNSDGQLDTEELEGYITQACSIWGLPQPQHAQVQGIFGQLDLNNDRTISRDELSVFLRHFFQEQVKCCALKLRLPRAL
ncbi:hypothetical protein GPECTOR_87g404 [Gonium pectorale]|uniref:EF-hand domain-containing protein n=1 Tax=Gonium pectorale TaxID=33097 RepID=A0A150G113_GONPE|nr:hypothetical protein GPECTOR_87g404 [Gonium pectorale]|eukprot:KXZ43542.1 hypothetical protein GPECTOR_87g404 [Gonium pectorale]